MDKFFDLFNGRIGLVRNDSDWDEDRDIICIDGIDYELSEYENGIDEWGEEFSVDWDKVVLFWGDGYRGEGCYSGYYKDEKSGMEFSIDIMNDYRVNEIVKS